MDHRACGHTEGFSSSFQKGEGIWKALLSDYVTDPLLVFHEDSAAEGNWVPNKVDIQ
jgi:hypothetical protein